MSRRGDDHGRQGARRSRARRGQGGGRADRRARLGDRSSSATTLPRTTTSVASTRPRSRSGSSSTDIRLPAETTEAELLERVEALNADDSIHGILVQLPLPDALDPARIIRALDPAKDVDGLHPFNAGSSTSAGRRSCRRRRVGIMALLAEYDIQLSGAKAVVVGRSDIVGKPVAQLLLQQNATVTICHSRTRDLARETLDADVLVVAVGSPALVTADMVKRGATVIDVGMNRTGRGARRRRRPRGDGRCGAHDAGAGRSRPDDYRNVCSETRFEAAQMRLTRLCVSRRLSYSSARCNNRSATRCPGRRLYV